ncbi:hypothetical protein BJ138DRAFT_1180662 [Hygrophoropsis aurantiaca]|uniref:Uncharacterized protein n=1 Tax=Hygrophoropsis aurantiaca TaxID=72124 RepID=A0ACB8AB51_9AGAM|nr:hypothetical protein BJ138DRAFT_1180662 [Hygrophoropsis aurantiaca]
MDAQVIANSVSATSFLFWESFITFGDEIEYIWSKPYRSPVKWLFLLTRYVGLASVICNVYGTVGGIHTAISCRGFLVIQVTMAQALVTLVELILIMRVHALYSQNCRMAAFLAFLVISGTLVAIVCLSFTVASSDFDSRCDVTHIGNSLASFGFAFVITEGILLFLTLFKCISTFKDTGRPVPVIMLMLRDGTAGFLAIISILIPSSVLLVANRGEYVSRMNPWFLAISSCAGCRLIINMQRLSLEKNHCQQCCHTVNQTLPILTSHINIEPIDTISSGLSS